MTGERRDDPLGTADEALAALRSELSIVPSPDFQARVRQRIEQRGAGGRSWTWILSAAAAVALVTVVVFAVLRDRRTEPSPTIAAGPSAPPAVPSADVPSATVPSDAAPPATDRHVRLAVARRPAAPVQPLVPSGEATRIARYVASVRVRPFADESLPYADPGAPLAERPALESAPLTVTPLVQEEGTNR
jgi:hypothetical protein